MAEVSVSRRFEVPGHEMWARIGGFGSLWEWHPAIATTEVFDGGRRRTNSVIDGGRVTETLLEQGDRHHTFRIDDGPLPFERLVATLRVRDQKGSACVVEWEATLEARDIPEPEAVEQARGFFQAGLDALSSSADIGADK